MLHIETGEITHTATGRVYDIPRHGHHNDRKVVRWFGATALLAALSLVLEVSAQGLTLSALVPAFIIATTGFQLINSHRLFTLVAPHEVRRWMRPVGFALYSIAAVIAVAALATAALHAAAR